MVHFSVFLINVWYDSSIIYVSDCWHANKKKHILWVNEYFLIQKQIYYSMILIFALIVFLPVLKTPSSQGFKFVQWVSERLTLKAVLSNAILALKLLMF